VTRTATTSTATITARDQALAHLEEQQAKVATWKAEKATAQSQFEALHERAGADALDDPTSAASTSRELQELQYRLDGADRAISTARALVFAAARAAARAEADEWANKLAVRRQELAKHETQTQRLLDQLLAHEGRFISVQHAYGFVFGGAQLAGDHPFQAMPILKSEQLREAVADAELQLKILTAVAEGKPLSQLKAVSPIGDFTDVLGYMNRTLLPDDFPESVRPGSGVIALALG
jgi:hypothetical protein